MRLGLQQFALEWSQLGHNVDYVCCPTHPLDFISPSRRYLWLKAWLRGGSQVISVNLTEYFVRSPFSRRRFWWRGKWQGSLYNLFFPSELSKKNYDLCIFDICYSALNLPRVNAERKIMRLNDNPWGFLHHMSPIVAQWFENLIKSSLVDSVWPVSTALGDWARKLNPGIPVQTLPNGVSLNSFARPLPDSNPTASSQKAVYLGTFQPWFDWELMVNVANNLPDWQIDLYGPNRSLVLPINLPPNLKLSGPLSFDQVPSMLSNYEVGLLPFKPSGNFLDYFDPLKAYQYWAAGLGIAATDTGRMGDALLPWACLGSDAESFANAIVSASEQRHEWHYDKALQKRLDESNWPVLANRALSTIGVA